MIRMLLPRTASGKGLAVLTAYFDDSGTHAGSPVVLTGGLYGNEHQWAQLETAWQAILDKPGDRWDCLTRFHMYDCDHGYGEFEGHSPGARDHLIYRLRNVILEAGLRGYAMALPGPEWGRLVTGDHLAGWGDAERFTVTNCILTTLEWAERESVETEVAFVFDDRPARSDANMRVFSIYQHYAETERPTPKPVGISFLNSEKTLPLQAADMYVWECNRWARGWLADRKARPRKHLQRFFETGRYRLQCGTPETIQRMVDNVSPGSWQEDALGRMAAFFNAENPNPKMLGRRAGS